IAAFLLMTSMRRRRPTAQAPPAPPPKPRGAGNGTMQPLRRDLDALMVELQELSRRISAEIDTRFAKLEAAMKDADRRIAVLNRLARDAGGEATLNTSTDCKLSNSRTPSLQDQEGGGRSSGDPRHTIIYELAD